mmetsp:Transcript_38942/g.62410  ORF Transcript_38942/g.62410 Transcript_38942/m.62410 type:complete len:110 (+) Transcript_38942:54-383(+)
MHRLIAACRSNAAAIFMPSIFPGTQFSSNYSSFAWTQTYYWLNLMWLNQKGVQFGKRLAGKGNDYYCSASAGVLVLSPLPRICCHFFATTGAAASVKRVLTGPVASVAR